MPFGNLHARIPTSLLSANVPFQSKIQFMATHQTTPSSASVLVVEDDELISSLLQYLLERESYEVFLAADGQAGQDFIQTRAATTVAILDVMLPLVDGYSLLRTLRAQPGWGNTRVIMLSAKTEGRDIARALDAGADDYLSKPFKVEELYARIRRYLPPRDPETGQ